MRTRLLLIAAGAAAVAGAACADDIQFYTYDVHGRLVRVQHDGTAVDGRDSQYAYDDADNRTERERTEPPPMAPGAPGGAAMEGGDDADRRTGADADRPAGTGAGGDAGSGAAAGPADALFDG